MRQSRGNKSNVSSKIITIATIAVALGIMMILIAFATGKGMQKEIQQKAVAFNGHLNVVHIENENQELTIYPFEDQPEVRELLDSHDQVVDYFPFAIKAGILKTSDDFEGILFKGVDSKYQWDALGDFLVRGSFPQLSDQNRSEILISENIATRLRLDLGDWVEAAFQYDASQQYPNRRKFTISGIYNSGFTDIDNSLIMGDIGHIQKINRWESNDIGGYQIMIENFKQLEDLSQKLYQELPMNLGVVSLLSKYELIFQWISIFDFNILIILIIMLVVGVMNMSTALLALIFERTAMIGLFKAYGATNRLIQRIFLTNGVLIMVRGLVAGNLLSLVFYFTQKQWSWIRLDPETYFVSSAPVHLTLWQILGVNVLFLLVSVVLLWLPSLMVMRIAPAKILRIT